MKQAARSKKFKVFIERTENYSHQVVVRASSAEEAERKVERMDNNDAFINEWNELQPGVETTYEAEELKGDEE